MGAKTCRRQKREESVLIGSAATYKDKEAPTLRSCLQLRYKTQRWLHINPATSTVITPRDVRVHPPAITITRTMDSSQPPMSKAPTVRRRERRPPATLRTKTGCLNCGCLSLCHGCLLSTCHSYCLSLVDFISYRPANASHPSSPFPPSPPKKRPCTSS